MAWFYIRFNPHICLQFYNNGWNMQFLVVFGFRRGVMRHFGVSCQIMLCIKYAFTPCAVCCLYLVFFKDNNHVFGSVGEAGKWDLITSGPWDTFEQTWSGLVWSAVIEAVCYDRIIQTSSLNQMSNEKKCAWKDALLQINFLAWSEFPGLLSALAAWSMKLLILIN